MLRSFPSSMSRSTVSGRKANAARREAAKATIGEPSCARSGAYSGCLCLLFSLPRPRESFRDDIRHRDSELCRFFPGVVEDVIGDGDFDIHRPSVVVVLSLHTIWLLLV